MFLFVLQVYFHANLKHVANSAEVSRTTQILEFMHKHLHDCDSSWYSYNVISISSRFKIMSPILKVIIKL